MLTRVLSVLLAFIIGAFQSVGITVKPVDFTPTMKIIGQYTCADKDPAIALAVEKTAFRSSVSENSIVLGGAFKGLSVKSVERKNAHTLLLQTNGEMDDDYAVGYVLASEKAVRADTALQAEIEIDMSRKDPGINGGNTASAIEDLAKKQAKSLIQKGIGKIPYVGGIVSKLLDSKLNEVLGIKSSPSIGDVLKKLSEISNQLTDISLKLDESSQQIMKLLYQEKNFEDVNKLATSLRADTLDIIKQITLIEEKAPDPSKATAEEVLLSEYTRSVRIASLMEFDGQYASNMVKNADTLFEYVAGNQVSMEDEEDIFAKAFDYACQDSVLGGEAAMVVAPYVNQISDIFSGSYRAMAMVAAAKLYVCENYNEITEAAKSNTGLANALSTLSRQGIYDKDNNEVFYPYLLSLFSESENDSIACRFNGIFDDEDKESVVSTYNRMVADRWFSFIKEARVTDKGITVSFIDLSQSIAGVTPMELGVDTNKHDEGTRTMVKNVNNALRERIFKSVDTAQIRKIIEHMLENGNKVFVEKKESDGLQVSRNLFEILEDYGFILPAAADKTCIFANDSSQSFDAQLVGLGVASNEYKASLSVSGCNCAENMKYYTNLTNVNDVNWKKTEYYHHSCSVTNGQLCNNRTTSEDCLFFYFTPAPIKLKTPEAFVDFITSVSEGNTYAQENVLLETDVNLSLDKYEIIWPETKYESCFKGTFDGGFHTIFNLTDTTAYPGGGLFRTLGEGACVANLNFENVRIEGTASNKSGYGTVAGRVTGNATISSVRVKNAFITGYDKLGGIVGEVTNGSLVIKDCDMVKEGETRSEIYATGRYAGGILGASTSKKSQNITVCTNSIAVTANSGSGTGGIVGYLANDSADQPHTVKYCINNGNVSSNGGNTGGIIGHLDTDSVLHEVAKNTNTGKVEAPLGNAGGIIGLSEGGAKSDTNDNFRLNNNSGNVTGKHAGGILGYNEDDTIIFDGSVNSGIIYATTNAGGIAGYLGNNDNDKSYIALNCKNTGTVTAKTGAAGGIFGHLDTDGSNQIISFNENTGTVTSEASYAGGIVAYSEGGGDFSQNKNSGAISGKNAGGVVGFNEDDAITFKGSVNFGVISASADAGGILGYTGNRNNDRTYIFDNCSNYGCIESTGSYAGGIAGTVDSDSLKHSFIYCQNHETVKGYISTGGIVGKLSGGGTFTGCVNNKAIVSQTTCAGGIAGYVVDDICRFTDCKNIAEIQGVQSCGGIMGEAGSKDVDDAFTFTGCTNTGNITSSQMNAGGIVGMLKTDNKNHSFSGCANSGNVLGASTAGGIIGFMYGGGTIANCSNSGAITVSASYAGGIIGRIEDDKCNFNGCSNTGEVSAAAYRGQTCGYDGNRKTTY